MSEINIEITDRKGENHKISAPTDMALNLMEIIKLYELAEEGTIGVCGGMAMCASCLCYIKSNHDLGEKGNDEEAMLSEVSVNEKNSRLSCQIFISEKMEGLKLEIAPEI